MHLQDDEEALLYFCKALSLKGKRIVQQSYDCEKFDGPEEVAILHNIGHIHYRARRFAKAEKNYHRALRIACTKNSYYHGDVAASLNCIGVARIHMQQEYSDSDNQEQTLGYFVEAHSIHQAHIGSNLSPTIATILNNVGRAKFFAEEYTDALKIYKEVLDIRMELLGDKHLDVAATLNNIAQTNVKLGNLEPALRQYTEYLDIATLLLGENHLDIASTLKCVAEIFFVKGDPYKSIQFYARVINIYKAALGCDHEEVCVLLNKMGNISYECGDLNEALSVYLEERRIESRVYGDINADILITHLNIARVYQAQDNLDEALKSYTDAYTIQLAFDDDEGLNRAITLTSIGFIHDKCGRYEDALKSFQEALNLRTRFMGNDNFDVSSTQNLIGMIHFKMSSFDLALEAFEQSRSIRCNLAPSVSSPEIATTVFNLASVHLECGRSLKAIKLFAECLYLETDTQNVSLSNVLRTLRIIKDIELRRDEIEPALQHFMKILQRCKQHPSIASSYLISTFLEYVSSCYLQLGETEHATELFAGFVKENCVPAAQ